MSQNSEDPIAAHLEFSRAALERATRDAGLLAAARKIAEVIIVALRGICDEIGQPLMREGNGK